MSKTVKILLILGGIVILLLALPLTLGALAPLKHQVSREVVYNHPVERVFDLLSNPLLTPEWNQNSTKVEILPSKQPDLFIWKEYDRDGGWFIFECVKKERPHRLEVKLEKSSYQAFQGLWTFELSPTGPGNKHTRLKITDEGEIHSVLFRFMFKYVLGEDFSIKSTQDQVGQYLDKRKTADKTQNRDLIKE